MTWTGFPITQGTDWCQLAFYNQFIAAIREREQILHSAGDEVTMVDAEEGLAPGGTTFQSGVGSRITVMQKRIEQLSAFFGTPALFPVGIDNTLSGNSGPDYGTYDLATFRAAAGLNAAGFTRKYPDGAGGVTVAYGIGQPGDYVGPWIWDELRDAISALHTVRVPSATTASLPWTYPWVVEWGGFSPYGAQPAVPDNTLWGGNVDVGTSPTPDFPAAWTSLITDWSEDNPGLGITGGVGLMYHWKTVGGPDYSRIRASKESVYSYFHNIPNPAGLTRSVEAVYHNPSNFSGDEFRDLGTGLVEGWNDISADIAVTIAGTDFGSDEYYPAADDITALPPKLHESENVAPVGGLSYSYGFQWGAWAAYIKYTGFTYP